MADKPNILWFVADQMRYDSLAHSGNPAAVTPHFDGLAEEGVSFSNAYCQNPVCVPSRCSFLTGEYPHTSGHRTMHYLMHRDDPNIMKTMKANGYEVIWIGRNDFIPSSWDKSAYCDQFFDGADLIEKSAQTDGSLSFGAGFPETEPTVAEVMQDVDCRYSFYMGSFPEHSLDQTFDWNCVTAALRYLEDRTHQDSKKPFFLYCTLLFPHPPYGCEEPWYSLINRSALPPRRPNVELLSGKAQMLREIRARQGLQSWTEDHFNELRAVYLGMAARFDHQLGLVCQKLKEIGEYDTTGIFVFSDHGDLTGDYGITEKCQNSFEDPLVKVPLVVKLPADCEVQSGSNGALVQLNDLPATVYELASIDPGYSQFGKSLCETLRTGGVHRDAVFCEGGRLAGEIQAMEPEHGPQSPYWPRISAQHESDVAHTKACMIRMGNLKYIRRLYEQDQLYDLSRDSMELTNCIDDPAYANQLAELKERLLTWYVETSDVVPTKMDKR